MVNLGLADPYAKPSMLLAPNQSGGGTNNQAVRVSTPALLDALLTNWHSMKHDIRKWVITA
jgi:hypothetical protein